MLIPKASVFPILVKPRGRRVPHDIVKDPRRRRDVAKVSRYAVEHRERDARCRGARFVQRPHRVDASTDGTVWTLVTPDVQGFTRACVYDHAGVGYSGPAPTPHTSRQMAGELHALFAAAGVRGPYVLVGHSFGGLNARIFVSEYPAEVAGLVLVDAATEWQDRVWGMLMPEQYRIWRDNLRDRPDGINFEAYRESVEQVRTVSRSLGALPLVVLTHGVPFPREPGTPDDIAERMERELQAQQVWLATLSSNSVQVVSAKSGHFIEVQNPKLVIAAVRETVEAVRTHRRVSRAPLAVLADAASE
jgi:pimeloyl-ACP methyl ester carboxylesterase